MQAAHFQNEIASLQKKTGDKVKLAASTRNRLEGKTISKYWTAISKARTPRDMIACLNVPGTDQSEDRSDRMAELMRNYHKELQNEYEFSDPNEVRSGLLSRS